jgi:hypothetical protein
MENKINKTNDPKKSEALNKALDAMLENGQNPDMDCSSGVCVIKGDKSLIERINKKIMKNNERNYFKCRCKKWKWCNSWRKLSSV